MTNQLPFDPSDHGRQSTGDDADPMREIPAQRPLAADAPSLVAGDGDVNPEPAQGLDEAEVAPVGTDDGNDSIVSKASGEEENTCSSHSPEEAESAPGDGSDDLDHHVGNPPDEALDAQSGNVTTAATHEPTSEAPGCSTSNRVNGILTNRWNLIEFMSRRLIVPSDAIAKYYDDLLRHVPGRVPIVAAPVSEELRSAVSGDDGVVFPVFLELKPGWEPGTTTVVPFADVVSIHFRTERDLEEHLARKFSNVGDSPPVVVTPELFSGGDQTLVDIAEGPPRMRKKQAAALHWASSWSGAVVVGMTVLRSEVDAEAATALGRILDGRPWGNVKVGSHLRALAQMRSGRPPRPGTDLESVLFSHIAEQFATHGLPGDPVEFVRSLPEHIEIDDRSALAFRKICDILDGEIEFKPFRKAGSPLAKGLLVALLRGSPERLQPWATDVARADPMSALTAGVLLGLTAGRHTLPSSMRPSDLDAALAEIELAAMTGVSSPGKAEVETSQPDATGGLQHRIRLESFPDIYLNQRPPAALNDLVADASPLKPEVERLCILLAIEQGWLGALSIRGERFRAALASGDHVSPAAKALRALLERD